MQDGSLQTQQRKPEESNGTTDFSPQHTDQHRTGADGKGDTSARTSVEVEDDASEVSEASTIVYDHVPYEQFEPRVAKLCKHLWPQSVVDIERMRGGGYNRIVGLTVHPPSEKESLSRKLIDPLPYVRYQRRHHQTEPPTKYILRVPRFLQARIDVEAAQTAFVGTTTSIPVPQLFTMDMSTSNPLECSYTIQRRISGTVLSSICDSLSHSQSIVLARKLGSMLRDLQCIAYSCPGELDPVSKIDILDFTIRDAFDNTEQIKQQPPARPQTGVGMICRLFDAWRDCYLDNCDIVPWEELKALVVELNEETGILASKEHRLCHLDLHPRNILVDISHPTELEITGVLDWDETVFAPMVVGCEPPLWLWRLKDTETMDEEELQRTSGDIPTDLRSREIKEVFDQAVGSEFVKLAYSEESNIARRLCAWAFDGAVAYKSWEVRAAQKLVDDWERKHGRPPKFAKTSSNVADAIQKDESDGDSGKS